MKLHIFPHTDPYILLSLIILLCGKVQLTELGLSWLSLKEIGCSLFYTSVISVL